MNILSLIFDAKINTEWSGVIKATTNFLNLILKQLSTTTSPISIIYVLMLCWSFIKLKCLQNEFLFNDALSPKIKRIL